MKRSSQICWMISQRVETTSIPQLPNKLFCYLTSIQRNLRWLPSLRELLVPQKGKMVKERELKVETLIQSHSNTTRTTTRTRIVSNVERNDIQRLLVRSSWQLTTRSQRRRVQRSLQDPWNRTARDQVHCLICVICSER